jgi:hypothetical protein
MDVCTKKTGNQSVLYLAGKPRKGEMLAGFEPHVSLRLQIEEAGH